MVRTSERKTQEELSDAFWRIIVQGFVEDGMTPQRLDELDTAVFEEFGDMARDGVVGEDNAFGKSHVSYILLSGTNFVSAMAQKEAQLRQRIEWMDDIDIHQEVTKVSKAELANMELYRQDIDLSGLFELAEDVKDNLDDE